MDKLKKILQLVDEKAELSKEYVAAVEKTDTKLMDEILEKHKAKGIEIEELKSSDSDENSEEKGNTDTSDDENSEENSKEE